MTLNNALLVILAVGVLIIAWLTDNNYQVKVQRHKYLERTRCWWVQMGVIHIRIGKVLITVWRDK